MMDCNRSVPKRTRSRSPSNGLPRKSVRTDPGIFYPSFKDIQASESSSRRSSTSNFVPQGDTQSGAKIPQHTADDNMSLNRSSSNGVVDPTASCAPANNELTREMVTLLLKTCDASTRHDLAIQRAATARRDYDNAQRHFDMYPPMAEQKQNRRAQTEKDVKQADAVLQPLRSSLLNTFETLFNSMSSRDPQRASADSSSLDPRKGLEPVLTELDKTRRVADEANNRNNRLEQRLDSLQPSLERLERLESVLSELDKTKAVAYQAAHKNNQLEQQLNSLQQASSNLVPREMLETMRSELDEARKVADQATRHNDQLERRLDSLQQAFNANTQDLKRHTDEVETLQKSIRSLKPSIEQDRARVETLMCQVEAHRVEHEKRMVAVEVDSRRHQVSIERADTSIGCLKEESSRHKKTGSEASMAIQKLHTKLANMDENKTGKHDSTNRVASLPRVELDAFKNEMLRYSKLHAADKNIHAVAIADLRRDVETEVRKLEARFEVGLKQGLQVLEDDAKSKEEIVFDQLAELEGKLQSRVEVGQLNERLDVLSHIVNDLREKVPGSPIVVAVGQLTERLDVLSHIVNDLREKLSGGQSGAADGQLTERLDVLSHIISDLDERFNRLQTDDMIRGMVQHMIPQITKTYPAPVQMQKSIEDLSRLHHTMGLQFDNKTNHMAAVMDGKLTHLGRTVQDLQAKVVGLTNQEEQIRKLEGDMAKLDKGVLALNRKTTPELSNEFTDLVERVEALQKKVNRLWDYSVDRDTAIGQLQVEFVELAKKVGVPDSDLPDWEGTGSDP